MPHRCSVVGCKNSNIKEECKKNGVRFFCFPTRDPAQRELWISAVKRLAEDGRTWRPKSKGSKICSEHFVGGQWSRTRGHPSYLPTINLGHDEKIGMNEKDIARFQRHQQRQLEKEQLLILATNSQPPPPPNNSFSMEDDTKVYGTLNPEITNASNKEKDIKETAVHKEVADQMDCQGEARELFEKLMSWKEQSFFFHEAHAFIDQLGRWQNSIKGI